MVELVVGPKSSAATRKAILPHVDDLAAFLGRRSASRIWCSFGYVVFLMWPVMTVHAWKAWNFGATYSQLLPATGNRLRHGMCIQRDAALHQCMVVCRESNDFLLPAMITFLNDKDWQLRAAFFHHICEMGSYAGSEGLQAFLLPCLEQVCCFLASVCMQVLGICQTA